MSQFLGVRSLVAALRGGSESGSLTRLQLAVCQSCKHLKAWLGLRSHFQTYMRVCRQAFAPLWPLAGAHRSLPCELFLSACASSWHGSWLSSKWAIWEWAEMSSRAPQTEDREMRQMRPRQKPWSFILLTAEVMSYRFCLCCWSLRPTVVHVGGEYTRVRVPGEKISVGRHGGWLPLQIKLCAHAKRSKRGRKRLCSHRITSPLRNFQACWFSFAVQNASGHFQALTALRKIKHIMILSTGVWGSKTILFSVKDLHWIIFTKTFFYIVSAWLNDG